MHCIAGAITAHPRGLGSGWRSLLQALTIAASDHNSAVVNQALDALQPVSEALYRGWQGHAFLSECVDAIMAAVANRQQEELSISALFMLQSVARRLSSTSGQHTAEAVAPDTQTPSDTPTPFVEERGEQDTAAVDTCEAWSMLMHTLGKVARLDHRARVADTAAQVAFDILQEYSVGWDSAVFEVCRMAILCYWCWCMVIVGVGAWWLHPYRYRHWQHIGICSAPFFPPLFPKDPHRSQVVVNDCILPMFDLPHRTFASFDGQPGPACDTDQRQRGAVLPLSGEGVPRVERQARRQLGQLWEIAAAQYAVRGASMTHPVGDGAGSMCVLSRCLVLGWCGVAPARVLLQWWT